MAVKENSSVQNDGEYISVHRLLATQLCDAFTTGSLDATTLLTLHTLFPGYRLMRCARPYLSALFSSKISYLVVYLLQSANACWSYCLHSCVPKAGDSLGEQFPLWTGEPVFSLTINVQSQGRT